MSMPFADRHDEPAIHGFLHEPAHPSGDSVAITHGAGSNCQSKLLVGMSDALAYTGFLVLRFDLPFRQARPQGPPHPGSAERDREGIQRAVALLRKRTKGRVFVGGHSYGGRQATILVSEHPQLVDGLLLLSYPLHPPRKPEQLRTGHFPKLTTPAFFAHGTRDPFGTIAEMTSALRLIPSPHALFEVDGAGHDLLAKKSGNKLPEDIVGEFQKASRTWKLS